MRRLLAVSLLLAAACASTRQPVTPGRPEIQLIQRSGLFFGSGYTAPMNIEVALTNQAPEPIVVRRIRLEPGVMTQYSIYSTEKVVKLALQPGETQTASMMVTAYTSVARLHPSEPLTVRVWVDYERGEKSFHELYMNEPVSE